MKTPLHAALLAAALSLASAPAHAACTYVKQMTMPVHYEPGSALPLVYGSINGAKAAMSLNTGAYTTTLLAAQAERRGMRLRTTYQGAWSASAMLAMQMGAQSGDPTVRMELEPATGAAVGTGKDVTTYMATVREFAIGPIKAPAGKLPVSDSEPNAPYDAIVGADFLLQSDLELALADNEIRFFRGLGCTDSFLAYWDKNAVVVPMQKTDVPQAVVAIKLNGKPALAMLDTGTPRSYVVPSLAAGAGVREPAAEAGKSGGDAEAFDGWLAKFDTLSIGDVSFGSPYLYVSRSEMAHPVPYQAVLGLDFMKAHRMLLANGQQMVYFSVDATTRAFSGQRPSVNVEQVGKPTRR
jgi:hypothetical protein